MTTAVEGVLNPVLVENDDPRALQFVGMEKSKSTLVWLCWFIPALIRGNGQGGTPYPPRQVTGRSGVAREVFRRGET